MARRVFFSFLYESDIWRASQVRNSWVTKPDREAAGFWDAAAWEEVKKKGEEAIKGWINKQLEDTSVTVVLIGAETSERKYVQYEINQSWNKGNGLIGTYVHNLKDENGETGVKGAVPFAILGYKGIRTYDWVSDNGYENLGDWVESAYKRAQEKIMHEENGIVRCITASLQFASLSRMPAALRERANHYMKWRFKNIRGNNGNLFLRRVSSK